QDVQSRFSTLSDPASALGVRLQHWSDMWPAVCDRPYLGSGLGTYKYVTRPYQRQLASGWFWNADNEYLEILVETGTAGLAAAVCGLGAFAWALVKLRREDQHRDLMLGGLFLLTALGLQSATDFGVTLLAVAIPALLLSNLAASAAASGRHVFPTDSIGASESLRLGLIFPVAFVVCAAAWEIKTSGTAVAFRERLPPSLSRLGAIPAESVDAEIAEGLRLLELTPDDAELQAILARLYVYRFQLAEAQALAATHADTTPGAVWDRVSVVNLHRVAHLLPESDLLLLREEPNVATDLTAARNHFLKSAAHCDWLPDVHKNLAMLGFLSPDHDYSDTKELLLRSALLDAAEPDRLILNSQIGFQSNLDLIGELCCRRALTLAPKLWKDVLPFLRTTLDDESVLRVIQDFPELLVMFARTSNDRSITSHVVATLSSFSSSVLANRPLGWEHWLRAQAADLSGERTVAIAELRTAVGQNPDQIDWHLQLTDWLIAQEEFAEAETILKSVDAQGEYKSEIQRQLKSAIRGRLRQLGPSDQVP
ncbi:MAG: O-antigen ligase family protein, partial [Planctomycetaceae bacterium]|nr:O-antigen ligase family protein [Planctomycetaceae bacterium]